MNEQYIERYWRDATPADAIKEPPMVARFRQDDEGWIVIALLLGYDRCRQFKWSTPLDQHLPHCFKHCQVYDPPDPGEGWRLIDVNKDVPQAGDEMWALGKWEVRSPNLAFGKIFTYRRRIEQPKPEPKYIPFTWQDREQLRGRWVRCVDVPGNEWAITSMYIGGGGELRANGTHADRLLSGFVFVDTNEPVGKKVAQ